MSTKCEGSVTRWIGDLRSGGTAAAKHLWERYFDRLVRLARKKLHAQAGGAAEDEEDAALCAIDTFCRRIARGRFPQLADRHGLWPLLAKITVRKALSQIERHGAIKRGGGWLVDEAGLGGGDRPEASAGLDGFVGREPSPVGFASAAEEYQRLRSRLGNDSLRLVLDLSLDGYSPDEIAARIGRSVKTVGRKLDVIRTVWLDGEDRS
jgi:DNA-directed RNA polymerase specialized sigma24 family protein